MVTTKQWRPDHNGITGGYIVNTLSTYRQPDCAWDWPYFSRSVPRKLCLENCHRYFVNFAQKWIPLTIIIINNNANSSSGNKTSNKVVQHVLTKKIPVKMCSIIFTRYCDDAQIRNDGNYWGFVLSVDDPIQISVKIGVDGWYVGIYLRHISLYMIQTQNYWWTLLVHHWPCAYFDLDIPEAQCVWLAEQKTWTGTIEPKMSPISMF